MSAAKDERHLATAPTAGAPAVPVQVIFVRMPPEREKMPRTPAPPKRGRRRSPLFRFTRKRRSKTMLKTSMSFVLAVVIYLALGANLPTTNTVALVLLPTVLGAIGAIAWKTVIAVAAFSAFLKA